MDNFSRPKDRTSPLPLAIWFGTAWGAFWEFLADGFWESEATACARFTLRCTKAICFLPLGVFVQMDKVFVALNC